MAIHYCEIGSRHTTVTAASRRIPPPPPGVPPPPFAPPPGAIYSVESSSDLTGAPIACAALTADGNYDNACQIPSALLLAEIVYNLNGRRDVRQIAMLSDWWGKRPDQGQIEICIDTFHDDETGGIAVHCADDAPGCQEWQLVSNFLFPSTNSGKTSAVSTAAPPAPTSPATAPMRRAVCRTCRSHSRRSSRTSSRSA